MVDISNILVDILLFLFLVDIYSNPSGRPASDMSAIHNVYQISFLSTILKSDG